MESHFEKSSIPVTSYPSSPEPSTDEIHHQLTDEGLHYMIQEVQYYVSVILQQQKKFAATAANISASTL